jgi:hypothetical protein
MADGHISLASHSCTLAMNVSGFLSTYVLIVTTLQSSVHCVLGVSFLQKYNPVIDWRTCSLKFYDCHTVTCPIQPRHANVEIVHAHAIARVYVYVCIYKINARLLFAFPQY